MASGYSNGGYGNSGNTNSGYSNNKPYGGCNGGYNGGYNNNGGYNGGNPSGKDKLVAGLLAIFLGGLGVQYFYLGKVGAGLICILLSCVTCGVWEIVTLIQGIYMLTLDQRVFDEKYVYNQATFPLF